MANSTIIIRTDDIDIRLAGRRMTDLPAAGTYLSIEKVSNRSTHIEGLNRTTTNVRSNASSYRVTLTLIQNSPDDAFVAGAIAALAAGNTVLPISVKYGSTNYVSGSGDVETEPTREVAADSAPTVAYTIVGSFQIAKVGKFKPPELLTEDEIEAFVPA